MVVLPGDPGDPTWNSSCTGCTDPLATNYASTATIDDGSCTYVTDCNGVINGTSVTDSCGVCQSAYIYNFITHVPTFVSNANTLIPGIDYNPAQQIVVMPGDPGDPNWNSSCSGCTDPLATNYVSTATIDDGSCIYAPTCGAITGVNTTDVIHDRAWFNWDNMNSSTCDVDQIRFRYREVGTTAYSTKTMGAPVGNSAP